MDRCRRFMLTTPVRSRHSIVLCDASVVFINCVIDGSVADIVTLYDVIMHAKANFAKRPFLGTRTFLPVRACVCAVLCGRFLLAVLSGSRCAWTLQVPDVWAVH